MFEQLLQEWKDAIESQDRKTADELYNRIWKLLISQGQAYNDTMQAYQRRFGISVFNTRFGQLHMKGDRDEPSGNSRSTFSRSRDRR